MVKILHFADAHIDMANYGRHDPESGIPMRVMDFLNSLDTIIDAAIDEEVELVIFAGDAYKDRTPAPTFQREWGKRIMRLSEAGIVTILLVGNHDLSPSIGRAHALEEFKTLNVPNIIVADRPEFFRPGDMYDIPVQVIALPWVSRSGMVAYLDMDISDPGEVYSLLEGRLTEMVNDWVAEADPDLPIILCAHASIQGASFGGERTVTLGAELVLSGSLVRNKKLDYVAMGHIHKYQNLNENNHPPVIYPGSIERVDFGEARDKKYFITAEVEKNETKVNPHELKDIRKFIDLKLELTSDQDVSGQIRKLMPPAKEVKDAIIRLILEFPRDWESLIDDAALREMAEGAFEFHLIKRPKIDTRIRIPEDKNVGSMQPEELLDIYWKSAHTDAADKEELLGLAQKIINKASSKDKNA